MPLTDEQKQILDRHPHSCFRKRLHLISHAEIENALADALESLVGGHYKIRITRWSEPTTVSHGIGEDIEMSAIITGEREQRKDEFTPADERESEPLSD